MQTDISFENDTPGPAFNGVDAEVRTQVFNAYSLHQVRADASWSFDIGVGVRWFNTDTTLTLNPGLAAGRSGGTDDNWFDPLAAARVQFDIADRWSATAFVD